MLDLIEKIGPFVGLAAFIGLAVLAFLIFQQSRDVRRLREWAGRAPERALEAADASATASEARGEAAGEVRPGRFARVWGGVSGWIGARYQAFDRGLPIDGRILLGVLAAGVVAAGVVTSGFGLVGGDEGGKEKGGKGGGGRPEVAVLNGTATVDLAHKVTTEVVRPAGYKVNVEENAPTDFTESVIMYEPRDRGDAAQFARAIAKQLGETPTEEIAADVQAVVEGAPLALVIGADDATF
jgi:LytR cell envelope-related transcriptional attenuator